MTDRKCEKIWEKPELMIISSGETVETVLRVSDDPWDFQGDEDERYN